MATPTTHQKIESMVQRCTDRALCDIFSGTMDHLFTANAPKGRTADMLLGLAKAKARAEIVKRCMEASPELRNRMAEAKAKAQRAEAVWVAAGMADDGPEGTAFTDAWATIDDLEDGAVLVYLDKKGGKR